MKQLRVIVVTWALAGLGAGAGAGLGKLFGPQGVFLGAMVGATLAILYAVKLLVALHWFDRERRRGGTIGGLCGLALAAPLASMNLDSPPIAVAVAALTGIGVIAGAGWKAAR
jgi:multidrug transporter EmrE-like cation transporter